MDRLDLPLPDNYKILQFITKRNIFVENMLYSICAEWAIDHFGLGLT